MDPDREPFDWLEDARTRHGGLRMVHSAVARGWLEGRSPELVARRMALVEALGRLLGDPRTPARDIIQIGRILALMAHGGRRDVVD